MSWILGLSGLVAVLYYTFTSGHGSHFSGIFYLPALVLLACAPLCITLMSYSFEDIWASLKAVREAFGFRVQKSRSELFEKLNAFAAEVRAGRASQALELADGSARPLLRQLGVLVVRQYSATEIEETAFTALQVQTSALKRSEEVFNTLAKVAPAAGLLGTVLGLIELLRDMSALSKLGPSMALALLCTLYGLLLANGVYQPFARMIRTLAQVRWEEGRLLARGLALIASGRPAADVRRGFESAHEEMRAPLAGEAHAS